jgi:hypothetical protein
VVSGAVSATGFVLAVSDQGIGMAPDRIAEANVLLANPPVVGLAMSRALGLHVVGSLAQRHGITVELRPGAPGGVVALVALPTAVLEPRPVSAPPTPATGNPIYSPDLDAQGEAEPLGARRLVSRPPDEPPVEEWGRETAATTMPITPPAPVVPEAPAPEAPVVDAPAAAAPTFDIPTVDVSSTFDTPADTPADVPPDTPAVTPTYDTPVTPTDDTPVTPADDTPPVADQPTYDAPTYDTPTYDAPPSSSPPSPEPEPDPSESTFQEAAPLATRVPGQHLTHHPRMTTEAADTEADPMRAYRVHELLTRHSQGKRRGQAGEEFPAESSPVPGAHGVQEDGR